LQTALVDRVQHLLRKFRGQFALGQQLKTVRVFLEPLQQGARRPTAAQKPEREFALVAIHFAVEEGGNQLTLLVGKHGSSQGPGELGLPKTPGLVNTLFL
jgi:hypothetical protein